MKLFLILAGIALIYFGSQYFFGSAGTAVDCPAEPLPDCTTISRTGSHVTVSNQCDFDVTVRWEFLAGANKLHDLAPGGEQTVSSFPVKVTGVSCCSEYNRCW